MIDHLADVESDLSRFHRVDDIHQLDGPRFFRLAWRLSAYEGVIAMRLHEQQRQRDERSSPAARAPAHGSGGSKVLPLPAFAATHGDLIEKRRAT